MQAGEGGTARVGGTATPVSAVDDPRSEEGVPGSTVEGARTKTREMAERWLRKLARRNLLLLAARGDMLDTLRDVPEQMHKVARQSRLVIELVDDFRSGKYRAMSWWAVALSVSALLYAISPADVVPDYIPLVGTLDDLAVIAVATRLLRNELRKYCEFKGYPVADYF
jgi:uncharacterized membrane protein YkvA (DUF1232 family)